MAKVIISCLVILGVVFSYFNCIADEGPLMVEDTWPPYTIGEIGTPVGGIAAEITKAVFRRIGVEPRLELFPWKRVLKMAEIGKVDGIMLLMKTKERQAFLVYTDKLFTNIDRVFANNSSEKIVIQSIEDLKDYRIGYVFGYAYGDRVDTLLFKLSKKTFKAYTPEENVENLVIKWVDFIIDTSPVVERILGDNPGWADKVHELDFDLKSYDYYIGISKKSKYATRIQEINKVISDMKQDGTMDRLRAGGKAN